MLLQTQTPTTGKTATSTAQNSKPAKKTTPHTTCNAANSTNQKTIGINKLGTLLSSQTTDTTGTKHNQTAMPSLRSNFSSLPPPTSPSKSANRTRHQQKTSNTSTTTNHHNRQQTRSQSRTSAQHTPKQLHNPKGGPPPTPGQLPNYTTPSTPPQIHPPPTTSAPPRAPLARAPGSASQACVCPMDSLRDCQPDEC